jgi:hypothetical protein
MTVMFTGMGTGSFDKTEATETTTTSASAAASTSYNSDLYSLAGMEYGWNAAGGIGTNYNSIKQSGVEESSDTADNTATAALSLGHRISKGMAVGRATSLSVSFTQSISGSGSDNGTRGWGTGVGGDISGSSRGVGGTTFAGISGSYSYSESISESSEDTELESQYARADISRNQTINRLSALTATAGTEWRRQLSSQSEGTTRSANANVNYRHQRFLSIYALNYDTIASYRVTFNPNEDQVATMEWRNTWRYTVGLLDLSLSFDMSRQGDAPTRGSLFFRATRSF